MPTRCRLAALAGAAIVNFTAVIETAAAANSAPPEWLHVVRRDAYDGVTDDLVTAGRGIPALASAAIGPVFVDPSAPTYAERRRAVLSRPPSIANGFGRLFGANVDPRTEKPTGGDGRIAGDEVLAYATDKGGNQSAGMVLQVPAQFNPAHACVVAIATPGSQNVWADMQRAGYWGLVRGCAVVWTDKGTGAGVNDLDSSHTVYADGTVALVSGADGKAARFVVERNAALETYTAVHPHRLAYKWAHAGSNQEAEWGQSVLRAVEFALHELGNRSWPGDAVVTRRSTHVIATGFSNGGGAVLKAAEQDDRGLLDGVVAVSPQIITPVSTRVVIEQGGKRRVGANRTIFDALSYSNLYKSCASLALPALLGTAALPFAANRCMSLAEAGWLKAQDTAGQAREALDRLHAFGLQPEADSQITSTSLPEQATLGQASQYGRFDVSEHLCNLSFAAVDKNGSPRAVTSSERGQLFVNQLGGTPDGRTITTVNDVSPGGAIQSTLSVSPSTGRQDYNFDAAVCLRELAIGTSAHALRVQAGLRSIAATGGLHDLPTIIVHGRADPVEPPDFTSRAFVGLNSLVAARPERLRYIEVTRASHGDPPSSISGLIPLSLYQIRALEAMYQHLFDKRPLPPSQLVRTLEPSGTLAGKPAIEAGDVPPISWHSSSSTQIEVIRGKVRIPD